METLRDNPCAASSEADAQTEIQSLIARARSAQAAIESYSQEEADSLATSVGWQVYKSREALARLAVEEGGFGNVPDKVTKIALRVLGTLADMASIKTCGVIEEDAARGLIKIAKPVGVIAALIPTTGPDATPPVKALAAVKARNAIIVAPHPRTARTTAAAVEIMRKGCEKAGAPADLIQVIAQPSIAKTAQLMRMSDLIVATGGASMVKAAYSSGTPAYGVGVGNAVHVVDETADLDDAAQMIARAKTFDYATSCLADNSVVAHSSIYSGLKQRLAGLGGHVCTPEEKLRLAAVMWPEGQHIPSIDIVAKPASRIAGLAGITLAPGCSFLIVEEDGVGEAYPFSGEKLSVVLALYRYQGGIEAATGLVNRITSYQGAGHTCGIHTRREDHVMALALGTKTARVLVNQNLNEGAGSVRNFLPYTLSLSCGTWGGNITTENVNVRHFLNLTWVSRPVAPRPLRPEEIFGAHWAKHGQD
jgi:sulfoacetaldehyde dehydrogenase